MNAVSGEYHLTVDRDSLSWPDRPGCEAFSDRHGHRLPRAPDHKHTLTRNPYGIDTSEEGPVGPGRLQSEHAELGCNERCGGYGSGGGRESITHLVTGKELNGGADQVCWRYGQRPDPSSGPFLRHCAGDPGQE
jgi:hypothetical protein